MVLYARKNEIPILRELVHSLRGIGVGIHVLPGTYKHMLPVKGEKRGKRALQTRDQTSRNG